MLSTNERRRYNVTSSFIGWAHIQNDTYISNTGFEWKSSVCSVNLYRWLSVWLRFSSVSHSVSRITIRVHIVRTSSPSVIVTLHLSMKYLGRHNVVFFYITVRMMSRRVINLKTSGWRLCKWQPFCFPNRPCFTILTVLVNDQKCLANFLFLDLKWKFCHHSKAEQTSDTFLLTLS